MGKRPILAWRRGNRPFQNKLDHIPLMRYGIGSLRDNQRTRSCLIQINCVWKKQLTMKRWSCDRPATFDVT